MELKEQARMLIELSKHFDRLVYENELDEFEIKLVTRDFFCLMFRRLKNEYKLEILEDLDNIHKKLL